jgi:hypothetical protein
MRFMAVPGVVAMAQCSPRGHGNQLIQSAECKVCGRCDRYATEFHNGIAMRSLRSCGTPRALAADDAGQVPPPQDSEYVCEKLCGRMARVKLNWTDLLAIEPPGPSGVSSVP